MQENPLGAMLGRSPAAAAGSPPGEAGDPDQPSDAGGCRWQAVRLLIAATGTIVVGDMAGAAHV
jgi:hypothetical protein